MQGSKRDSNQRPWPVLLRCNTLQHIETHFQTLQHTLQDTATHSDALQHAAQHSATLWNTVQCVQRDAKKRTPAMASAIFPPVTHTNTHTQSHTHVHKHAHTHTHTCTHTCTHIHTHKHEGGMSKMCMRMSHHFTQMTESCHSHQ